MDHNSYWLSRMSLERKSSLGSYIIQYNKVAQNLRIALLELCGDRDISRLELVREIFQAIDGNNSGVITSQEMLSFLRLPELHLFDEDPQNAEKFCELLLEQIDEDGNGSISLEEIATFIFPEDFENEPLEHEPGIIYDLSRRELVQRISSVAGHGSDEVILQEFATLAEATVRKGHLEDRIVKKALLNLFIPQFSRNLKENEADLIVRKLDADHHDRISAKSFKQWLFPASNYEDKMKQATYLYGVIKEKYGGSPREMFESFKSYGADCIYKADFITNMKGVDPSLSRQDAQDLCNALTGGEKSITFLNMLDFLGYCEEYERQEDDNTFYTQHSTSSAPFSPDPDATSQPLSSTYEEPGQRFSGTNSLSEKSATLTTRANSLEKKNSINIFAMQYNRIAQQLRTSLVLLAGDRDMTHYELVKEAFAQIDGNNSGVVTAQEMMSFLKLPQLRLFEEDPTQAEKFCQLLLEQIDENNDSTISLEELATFIFPEDFHQELLDYEPGIIYDLARRMLVQKLSNVASQGSDEVLLEEFAKLGKATAKKGHLEDRAVKKALINLHIPQLARNLNEDEADLILRKLNADHHDRISAKSFKQWLFPASNYEDKMKQATYLYGVIKEKYGGSPREMFESFKSYGADCIYKPDFITNIKGVDPSLSRQDAQDLCNALTGGEKSITFLNMLDFLGYCEEYERQEDDNTFYTQHSLQERSENTNDERNDANFQSQPNFDLASDERSNKRPPQVPSLPLQNNNNQQSSNPAGIGGRDIEETPPMLATPAGQLNRQNGGFLHVQSLATPSNDDDNMSAVTSNLSSPRNSVYASGMSTPRRRDGGVNRSSAASTASNLHRTPSFKSKSGGSVVSSGGKNVQFDRTVSTSDSYARKYNKIAQDLREALLRLSSDRGMNHIDIVKEVFHHIDDNDSGVLTSKEMLTFLQLPELQLFNDQDMSIHNAEKFCQLLLEQMDENGDGTISLEELATFIFPEDFHQDQLEYESGIIYDLTRKALVQKVSRVAAQGSDDLILQEFASLGKGTVRKGHLEDRAAKKSLTNLFIPQFNRNLLENEAELIMNKLDMDHHGRISAKSFKQWLFPVNVMEEKSKHATYMYEIVKEKFFGNPKELFESFQSYGADCIYKADFVTNIRAIDTSLSRHDAQDLANALCAGEKAITYGNLLDFLEHCKEYEEGGREQSYAGESLQHQSSEDEMDDLRRSIEEAQRRSRDPITTPKNQNQSMIDDIARRYALTTPSYEESHSPTVGGVKLVPDNASVMSGPLTPPPPIIGSNLNIAIPPSDNISVLTAGTATIATAATGVRKSSKPAAIAPPPAPRPTITDEEREYVKNLLSSSSSSKLISTPLSPLQKSSMLYKSLSQNNINDGNINPSASLLSSFNGVVGDQKFDFAKSQTLADIGFPVNQSMQSFKLSSKSLDANETTVKHGAVGYSAKELTEFGFSSHSGRWRGFPYDSFTCCNTSHFICPNSSKKSKSSLKKTTKKPTISPQESLTLYLEKKMKVNEKRSKSPRSFIPAGSTVNLYSPRHSATTLNSSMSMTGSTTIRSSASSSRSHRELGGSEGSRNISQRGNRLHQTSRF